MTIDSKMSIASGVSASFSRAASALNRMSLVVFEGETKVAGNEKALASFSQFQTSVKGVSNSVVKAGDNLNSVAQEFEKIDQKIAQLPKFSFGG